MPYFNPITLKAEGLRALRVPEWELLIEDHLRSLTPQREFDQNAKARSLLMESNKTFLRQKGEVEIEELSPEQMERQLSEATPRVIFDIFLSFSSVDWTQVLALYNRLTTTYNKTVYVDRFCDPKLNPTNVSRATALVLRRRMAQSKSLFCATTQDTTTSAWVPWELGFEDGYTGKVAILPITTKVNFGGREYFEAYPEVLEQPSFLEIHERGLKPEPWDTWVTSPRRL